MNAVAAAARCTVCGGALARELLRIARPDRFERHVGIAEAGYSRAWVECGDCGVATNVHRPENRARLASIAAGYYEVDFQAATIGEKYAKVMALPPAASDNALRVGRVHAFMADWLRPDATAAKVLDIGAGTGVFLARFLRESPPGRAWKALAVEPDPTAAAHLRSLGLFEVRDAVYTASSGLRDYDLCTLNKIVEHVPEPVPLLRDAGAALRDPGGVVYVEVPDKLTIDHRRPEDNILGALHCHLYDFRSLGILLERARLVPLRIDQLFEPSGKISVAAFATLPSTLAARAAGGPA
jgi:SAM-dependent methyltransferase